MESTFQLKNRQELEEFLQELVLHVDRPEDVDALLTVLRELRETDVETPSVQSSLDEDPRMAVLMDRYDIFKMHSDRVVRIGFVRGVENARRVRPGLNAMRDSVYFLHESDSL